jgi:O-antigen/teichoic acid export membrane protein
LRNLLFKNSLSGLIQNILTTILVFISIPLFIKMLGVDAYGIFVLVSVIGNLNIFTNIGLNTSLIKYISEQGKCSESDKDILVSFILYFLIVIPVSLTVLVFSDFILVNILNIPGNYINDSVYLFFYLIIANSLLMLGQIATSILDSQQKIFLTNTLQIIYNLLYWGLIFVFLLMKLGLKEIGLPILISAIVWFFLVNYYAYKNWGKINIFIAFSDFKRIAKKQTALGFQVYLSGLIGFFNEPLTKILISQFLGVSFVSFFDIALKIRNQLWGLFGKIFHPLTPYISQLHDKSKINSIINDMEKKILLLSIPVVVIIIFIIKPFITLWIGKNVEIISLSCIFVVSGYLLFSISVLPVYVFLMIKGYPKKTIIIQAQNVLVNSIVFFFLMQLIGYYSVIVANLLSIMFSFVLCLYYQKKYLNSIIFDSLKEITRYILLFIILFFSSFFINSFLHDNISILIIIPIANLFITYLIFRYMNYITEEDLATYLGKNNFYSDMARKFIIR